MTSRSRALTKKRRIDFMSSASNIWGHISVRKVIC